MALFKPTVVVFAKAAHRRPQWFHALYPEVRTASMQFILKRLLDIVVAAALLVFVAPLMLLVALLVSLDGAKPIFGHTRIGNKGRPFQCLKFRSMVPNAERALEDLLARDAAAAELWQRSRKLEQDPRVTRIGHFLRVTSIDELPQLFNVLRGDMSLVGPRPVVQAELREHYGRSASAYMSVRPGITGLWQVSGRSNTTYDERVALDVDYVEKFSLKRDLSILAKTVPAVLMRRGAR